MMQRWVRAAIVLRQAVLADPNRNRNIVVSNASQKPWKSHNVVELHFEQANDICVSKIPVALDQIAVRLRSIFVKAYVHM